MAYSMSLPLVPLGWPNPSNPWNREEVAGEGEEEMREEREEEEEERGDVGGRLKALERRFILKMRVQAEDTSSSSSLVVGRAPKRLVKDVAFQDPQDLLESWAVERVVAPAPADELQHL